MNPRRCQLTHVVALRSRAAYSSSACRCSDSKKTAAQHLFEQAEREERHERQGESNFDKERRLRSRPDPAAWGGEERMQDQIYRMLVDSYRPQPVTGWSQKKEVQKPTEREPVPPTKSLEEDIEDSQEEAEAEPEPAPQYPWDVSFKAPDHYISTVKLRPPRRPKSKLASKIDNTARLANARDKRVDHAWHGGKAQQNSTPREPVAGPIGAWSNLVEERIRQAQAEGRFKHIQGRGKPFQKDLNENNPFISRTEFLLNRIVSSQQAVPPWIDLQQQLDSQLETFRTTLRGDWVRRAVRMITLSGFDHLSKPDAIEKAARIYKDPDWEMRERGFHDISMKSINSLTRSYNAMAPASARRTPYSLEAELESCYRDGVYMIETELHKRLDTLNAPEDPHILEAEEATQRTSMWQAFKQLFKEKPWKQ